MACDTSVRLMVRRTNIIATCRFNTKIANESARAQHAGSLVCPCNEVRLKSAVGTDLLVGRVCCIAVPLAFGALAIALGQDANWDLRNYHWYNPYALLTGRFRFDL